MTNHPEADEYWFVRKGAAKVTLAGHAATCRGAPAMSSTCRATCRTTSIPSWPLRICGTADLRTAARRPGSGAGQVRGRRAKAHDLLRLQGAYRPDLRHRDPIDGTSGSRWSQRQQIIYNGAIGPYRIARRRATRSTSCGYGTAKAIYDGRLINPTVTGPGQIRGTGFLDGSEYTIAAGDIVWIPRNQLHFVDPGTGKVGYFPVGMPSSQSGFPAPPPTPDVEEAGSNRRDRFTLVNFVSFCRRCRGIWIARRAAWCPGPVEKFPDTVTVSPGPQTNLFHHVMKKADVLAALAQVKDFAGLFVKNNAAPGCGRVANTTKLPWKLTPRPTSSGSSIGHGQGRSRAFLVAGGSDAAWHHLRSWRRGYPDVSRGMAYQICPRPAGSSTVALRSLRYNAPVLLAGGSAGSQAPISPVTTKAQIRQFYERAMQVRPASSPGSIASSSIARKG